MHWRRAAAVGALVGLIGLSSGLDRVVGESPTDRAFLFNYSVSIRGIPEGARSLSIWIPVPRTNRYQKVLEVDVDAPLEYQVTRDEQYGNRMLHLSGSAPLPETLQLEFVARVERRAFSALYEPRVQQSEPPLPDDLAPDRLVPIDGVIAELAETITRDARTPLEEARAIYDYVTDTMRYDKSGEGWGRGDAVYACDARSGNCTDFHSLIIAMARAKGIPARFVIGFPVPDDRKAAEVLGYHCWAELYVDGYGWLPMDSSEANKHPEKRQMLFGGLDANRIEFTHGRDLRLEPPASQALNFFVYPHVEVDGVEHPDVQCEFSFVDIKT